MRGRRRRRYIALAMAAVFLVWFLGFSSFVFPQRVTMRFLNRLSNGHIWAAQQLTLERSLNLDIRSRALYRPLFGAMNFNVTRARVERGVAQVDVAVSTVDLVYLMNDISGEVTRVMLSAGPNRASRELFYGILHQRLREPGLATFNFSATAQLVRVRGRWRIDLRASEGLADAITGGMATIIGHESNSPVRR